jgi:Xaa-Pro aminopeptidase
MECKIIKRRIRTIRRQLNKNRISCLIVAKPANVTCATGFSGDESWAIITAGKTYLLTDSRFTEQAQSECPNCIIIERKKSLAETAAEVIGKLKSIRTAGVEKTISLAAYELLKKNIKARLKPVANIVESVRSTKDGGEIGCVRAAARIAIKAIAQVRKYMKTGITENELAGRLDLQIRRLGGQNSFETIVAFGANASRPHHRPSDRKLKRDDTILIDFGARFKSYCCDITRCFVAGRPSAFYKKVYNAVRQAQDAAIKMIKSGVEIKKVDAAAREVIKKHNLPVYGHGTGHGLGLEVHEEPVVSPKSRGRFKAGEIITVEPAVYIPGKIGVRIEDDVLVTKTGCKILSR